MSTQFSVRLAKEHHVFSAAHFITFNTDVCERLHGHNYRVQVEVLGPLDENQYVVDFIALRDELKTITDTLDHRMLLPTGHPLIRVTASKTEVEVAFTPDGRRWVFPLGDCVILPIPNTTAELLADYIGRQLLAAVEVRTGTRPARLRVEVDENHGQWGVCELSHE
ncbi:MAG: 6-pyruvoyl tetrahydropterin synthase family protein [Pirellulaceae bacterium]|nr:6-pyruvoyl tetrahydropterin synthase family protein [Pirellulaceae bacterium]